MRDADPHPLQVLALGKQFCGWKQVLHLLEVCLPWSPRNASGSRVACLSEQAWLMVGQKVPALHASFYSCPAQALSLPSRHSCQRLLSSEV